MLLSPALLPYCAPALRCTQAGPAYTEAFLSVLKNVRMAPHNLRGLCGVAALLPPTTLPVACTPLLPRHTSGVAMLTCSAPATAGDQGRDRPVCPGPAIADAARCAGLGSGLAAAWLMA